ncbi:phosphotransferase enzyme family protein [Streptomonospora litoralis]|uniref:Homoserine kinase n=1 Tax=Streptomonospora litoralis TaxID=2498135 RepID=A0A4P6Q702_9ACTN|nr:aminoglycoside phosphotransferase family protein [Streptomonospora litoralis]QBI56130.1 homoserine kinase [Streptomonospora litoralis]
MPNSAGLSATVARVLDERYGLAPAQLSPVRGGQHTVNLRADSGKRAMFVKTYEDSADLATERRAIALSEFAGENGVPVSPVIDNREGDPIDTSSPVAMSVWEWMPGSAAQELNPSIAEQAGRALGHLHRATADLTESRRPAGPVQDAWRGIDTDGISATIDHLLGIIEERVHAGQAGPFDTLAARTLTERRAMLPALPSLAAELPGDLTVQVLHGDYAPRNLLFDDEGRLTAVLDFSPPTPGLLAYDIGRAALFATTLARGDWLDCANALLTAYLDVNPTVTASDLQACYHVPVIQLLRSLYGIKQHYLSPGIDQADLDDFWHMRHRAAQTLLEHRGSIEDMLTKLAHHLPPTRPSRC